MNTSITEQFALLVINKDKYPGNIMDYNIFAGAFALGLYELNRNRVLEIVRGDRAKEDILISIKSELPKDMGHLSLLYEAIVSDRKRTLSNILYIFTIGYSCREYLSNIAEHLYEQGDVYQNIKKGFFAKEVKLYKAKEESVKETVECIRKNISSAKLNIDTLVLCKALIKADMIKLYFTKDESLRIKKVIDNEAGDRSDTIIDDTIKVMDNIFSIMIAIITSVL